METFPEIRTSHGGVKSAVRHDYLGHAFSAGEQPVHPRHDHPSPRWSKPPCRLVVTASQGSPRYTETYRASASGARRTPPAPTRTGTPRRAPPFSTVRERG